ncbi:MAG: M12 family metallo-peptidase [Saprospiraceae bacterium]|nr:hypothetical protein [Lewinella sp.]
MFSLKTRNAASLLVVLLSCLFAYPLLSQEYSFQPDLRQISGLLDRAPLQGGGRAAGVTIELPTPEGKLIRFETMESPVVSARIAQRLQLRTYALQAPDGIVGRLTYTPSGLFGVFLEYGRLYFLELTDAATGQYRTIYGQGSVEDHVCQVEATANSVLPATEKQFIPGAPVNPVAAMSFGTNLRTYDLVVVGTEEYTAYFADQATAETNIVNIVNAFNLIYNTEMSIHLNLVDYVALTTDSYDSENQGGANLAGTIIADVYPNTANYDLGQVFHKTASGGSGEAGLGVVCTGDKGKGWSSDSKPIATNSSWIILAAHEIGHQFGAEHSFDGTTNYCRNRAAGSAYEPMSGSTIMSYFGVCDNQNVSPPELTVFNVHSLDQMNTYVTTGSGNTCPVSSANGNTPPIASANPMSSTALTIPQATPFRLTGAGADADGDQLSFSWEQHDLASSAPPTTDDTPRANDPTAPLFRSYYPAPTPTRTFPNQASLLAHDYLNKDEALPTVGRAMNFRLTVRDYRAGGGGVNWDNLAVTVDNNNTPFALTAPNGEESWTAGTSQTIQWDVAATGGYCSSVNIRLSLDGGYTFPILLTAATANDGSQLVTIPANVNSTQARVEVSCANNSPVVFFDISDGDFPS